MDAMAQLPLGPWDVALLVAASYIALNSLVRLMRMRRDQLVDRLRTQMEQEKIREKQATPGKAPGQPGRAA